MMVIQSPKNSNIWRTHGRQDPLLPCLHSYMQAVKQKPSPCWIVCHGQMLSLCVQPRVQIQFSLKKHIILFGSLYSLALL